MKPIALLPPLVIALFACSDATAPDDLASIDRVAGPGRNDISGGYVIIDLGTLGGSRSRATGINGAGEIVGYSQTAGGEYHAFFWDGTMHDLGESGEESFANAINDAGDVVGTVDRSGVSRAALWPSPDYTLHLVGEPYTAGLDINNGRQIVGYSYSSAGRRSLLWEPDGTRRPLGDLGTGFGEAHGINDAGVAAGFSYANGTSMSDVGPPIAYRWDGAAHDLGTLGGVGSSAYDINAGGHVAGDSRASSGETHAFLWDGEMHDLGVPGGGTSSRGRGINDDDIVVGSFSSLSNGLPRAFVWDVAMHVLPILEGDVFSEAVALNAHGQIVGSSGAGATGVRAVLWREATPEERLATCSNEVTALLDATRLSRGQAHSLLRQLEAATRMLSTGRPTAARHKVRAFQNEVRALRRAGTLTSGQAEELNTCVQTALTAGET